MSLFFNKIIINKKFYFFAFFSAFGLVLDIGTFYIFIETGMHIFLSNILSGFIAIVFVYITSSKFVFKKERYSLNKFIFFTFYKIISIFLFSAILWSIVIFLNAPVLPTKILIVPFSLLTNYYFSSIIITNKK